jgi:hypothetical protein
VGIIVLDAQEIRQLSTYGTRQADLFTIASATDIHETKYDDPANPVSKDAKVVSGITAASYASFVDFVEANGLARFGLHNGTL